MSQSRAVPVQKGEHLVTVYTKTTRPTRITIPTGSRIVNVKARALGRGRDRPEVQAKAITLASREWEDRWGPLPWSEVAIIIMHTDLDVVVELRVDP